MIARFVGSSETQLTAGLVFISTSLILNKRKFTALKKKCCPVVTWKTSASSPLGLRTAGASSGTVLKHLGVFVISSVPETVNELVSNPLIGS